MYTFTAYMNNITEWVEFIKPFELSFIPPRGMIFTRNEKSSTAYVVTDVEFNLTQKKFEIFFEEIDQIKGEIDWTPMTKFNLDFFPQIGMNLLNDDEEDIIYKIENILYVFNTKSISFELRQEMNY